MNFTKPHLHPLPLAHKVLGIVLVVCFLIMGLIGLILPIIPGFIFLFLAVHVLTRVSRRAAAYAHSQPWISRQLRHMDAVEKLSIGKRVRLALLVIARGTVNAIAWCVGIFKSGPRR